MDQDFFWFSIKICKKMSCYFYEKLLDFNEKKIFSQTASALLGTKNAQMIMKN